jgi:phosphoglycerate dehydrogenase-like enzyme
MKLAYLMKNGADIDKIVPKDDDYFEISMREDKSWDPESLKMLHDREGILVWKEMVTEDVIRAAPHLKIVQRLGVGYDELKGCFSITRERGIPCCNIEGVNKDTVGEHGMMLILAIARELIPMHEHARNARWPRSLSPDNPAFELVGKKLGVVGLGNTGTELAKRAKAFRMDILYNDVREIDSEVITSLGAKYSEKDDLYKEADIISINTDLNPSTLNLIGAREIALMKKSAVVICCARGGIIDQKALADALNSDEIFGAGIDVFDPEPLRPDNPLCSAKNIVLTPHIAGVTGDSLKRHYTWAYENVKRVLVHRQKPKWVVNGL